MISQVAIYRRIYPLVRFVSRGSNRQCAYRASDLAMTIHTALWRCTHPRKVLAYRRILRLAMQGRSEIQA